MKTLYLLLISFILLISCETTQYSTTETPYTSIDDYSLDYYNPFFSYYYSPYLYYFYSPYTYYSYFNPYFTYYYTPYTYYSYYPYNFYYNDYYNYSYHGHIKYPIKEQNVKREYIPSPTLKQKLNKQNTIPRKYSAPTQQRQTRPTYQNYSRPTQQRQVAPTQQRQTAPSQQKSNNSLHKK